MLELLIENEANTLINLSTLFVGFMLILFILKTKNRDLDDLRRYNWTAFDYKPFYKPIHQIKEKKHKPVITRVKANHKDKITIKEEHKFYIKENPNDSEPKQFLSLNEGKQLQDMINYVSSIRMIEDDPCSVESMYAFVQENQFEASKFNTNEQIDREILHILTR